MLAALIQVNDRVNLEALYCLRHVKTPVNEKVHHKADKNYIKGSTCSDLECLHVSNTSTLLIEEAVIHPLPEVFSGCIFIYEINQYIIQ